MSDSESGNHLLPERINPACAVLDFKGPFFAKFNVILLGNLRSRLHLPCYIRARFRVPKWDSPQRKSPPRAVRKSSLVLKISKGEPNL
jgi:hypothetical protein